MLRSLVGSEMCIRDRPRTSHFNLSAEDWKRRDALVADANYWSWFEHWWIQDFSWAGLKRQQPYNSTVKELQSYWINEAGTLYEFGSDDIDGKTVFRSWTRFHLPLHDIYGNLSPKHPDYKGGKKWHHNTTRKLFNDLRKSTVPTLSCLLYTSPSPRDS